MSYAPGQPVLWPITPNWASPVRETLSWRTDIKRGGNGHPHKRCLLPLPRRGFSFDVLVGQDVLERAIADNLRQSHGGRTWALPVYPDVQWIDPLPADTLRIDCRTVGFDFHAGKRAVLYAGPNTWEIVHIDAVDAGGLDLSAATASAWPRGARLYPAFDARLRTWPSEEALSDRAANTRVEFDVRESSPWPAIAPTMAYRELPVLASARDEGSNPESTYTRALDSVDSGTGPVTWFDHPGLPFRAQDHRPALHGRAEQAAWRSLLHHLRGRYANVWLPTWMSDLQLIAGIGSAAVTMTVGWVGYAALVFSDERARLMRCDVWIELHDGTVFMRRVIGAVDNGSSETLTLDSALGVAIAPGAVRRICWLHCMQQASDAIEIEHVTDADGTAVSATRFEAVRYDG